MKAVIKGAVVGGVIGLVAPVALAVGNEFLFAHSNGGSAEAKICFAERLWNLQRIQVKHAPGCKNKILESTPQILLVSVLGGSLLSALSLLAGKAQAGERTPRPSFLSKPQEETIETPKPQEPVASKPPSVEPVSKRLSEGFDLNPILRMSAIGGAVALVGFGALISYRNSPSAWNSGEGVKSGGSGNSLMGTIRETCVDTDTSETICFKEKNIRCEAIKGTGSLPNYYATYCYANGVKTDLTGKKTQYNGKGLCKETGREGTPGYEFTGKFIACVAAFKSGVLN